MFRKIMVITGSLLAFIWGTAHLIPANDIANGVYGSLSINNKNIILMEWINEGFTLIFIGLLVFIGEIIDKENNKTSKLIFILPPVMLFSMAILSLFTGFNIDFLPFKLCPLIFSLSGILILQGAFRRNFQR